MLKKIVALLCLFHVSIAFAADDDCPSAADVAEAQNPNAYKHCDYSKTGLNGVLHRALKGNLEESNEPKSTAKTSAEKSEEHSKNEKDFISISEFFNAQQLQIIRFNLIQKAATECVKGFVVNEERYLPAASKSLKLELIYRCL